MTPLLRSDEPPSAFAFRLKKATPPGDCSTPPAIIQIESAGHRRADNSEVTSLSYTLKHHPRARRVKLRVDPGGELTVTAPRSVRRSQVDAWVAERSEWVKSVRARQMRLRSDLDAATLGPRPQRIDLPAINEQWAVCYSEGHGEQLRLRVGATHDPRKLNFTLPADDFAGTDQRVAARLRRWLRLRADQALSPMIDALACQHGFNYASVTYRNQRTRWGSCSATGRLSINARLLLASPAACRYVIIHELVHTEHLNHSPAFWTRVAAIDPNYRAHESELDHLSQRLPDWV